MLSDIVFSSSSKTAENNSYCRNVASLSCHNYAIIKQVFISIKMRIGIIHKESINK